MTPKKFKTNRQKLNLSQKQLAEALGVNQSTISRAESGELSRKLQRAFELLILTKKK